MEVQYEIKRLLTCLLAFALTLTMTALPGFGGLPRTLPATGPKLHQGK